MTDIIPNGTNGGAPNAPLDKRPLDPHLFSGPMGTPDDVRVQAGYPVWNLIEAWLVANHDDEAVAAGYGDLPREEWEAAKRYYLAHKPFIDARIVANSQPAADDDIPPMQSADEYFAWLASRSPAAPGAAAGRPTAGSR